MRGTRLGKLAAASLAVALLSAGCASDDDGDSAGGGASSGSGDAVCDLSIGMFGALTGPNANLGINIKNGVELALNEYNEENADCEVALTDYDSQGIPDQAPALATQAVQDTKIVGIVGPAFSGESNAANPIFEEGGLPIITPSATNATLSQQGWSIFHRILGNDDQQGPAAAKYIKETLGSTKAFVIDDATDYGKGLADTVRTDLGASVIGNDTVQEGQDDFSGSVTKVTSAGADALFYGGYYAEAGPLVKQLRDGGWTGTFVAADGVKDPGFVEGAGAAAAEGAILTCPCAPPEATTGSFAADYEAAYGEAPGTYSAEGYDAANVFLAAIADGNGDRESILEFIKAYDEPGVTKQVKFDETGEVATVTIYAYKVEGGNIVGESAIE